LSLVVAGAAAAAGTGFVTLAPNRLVSGDPIALSEAVGVSSGIAMGLLAVFLVAASFVPPRPALHWSVAVSSACFLLISLMAAGGAAEAISTTSAKLARVSLGAGFWILTAAAILALVDALQRARAGRVAQFAVIAALAVAFAFMAQCGVFRALSLAHEYAIRRDAFAAAFWDHLILVAAAIGPAILIGFPLGIAAVRRQAMQGPLFAALNLMQTIPSIALFGLLIAPLSQLAEAFPTLATLGISGIGAAPAIIALIMYALLPVVRSSVTAIDGVDRGVIDAARGMGMTRSQLFRKIELPLALPVLFAGLRIVTVQTIGLTVIAALIGAGGLGTFVFAGLGQYAGDLILLGALPTIALALATDFLLQAAAGATQPRFGR
jgi:osmoprotectant transport system permease protein